MLIDVLVSAALASVKRAASCRSRTNARTTRMPMICSRITPFTSSMFSCIRSNSGMSRLASTPTMTTRSGTDTHTSHDRPGSSWIAMTIPPIDMIGAITMKFSAMRTTICTCCTSFVPRVMSVGAPNRPISSAENRSTRR